MKKVHIIVATEEESGLKSLARWVFQDSGRAEAVGALGKDAVLAEAFVQRLSKQIQREAQGVMDIDREVAEALQTLSRDFTPHSCGGFSVDDIEAQMRQRHAVEVIRDALDRLIKGGEVEIAGDDDEGVLFFRAV